jgi:hypothetical protein
MEDAPGSSADMSIGLMVHERLECCLGLRPELCRFDLNRSRFEEWMGWDGNGRETRKSAGWGQKSHAADTRRRDKR